MVKSELFLSLSFPGSFATSVVLLSHAPSQKCQMGKVNADDGEQQ